MKEEQVKSMVRERYDQIAQRADAPDCCGSNLEVTNLMADDYAPVGGYQPEADLGLGCGLPTAFARLRPGNTVLDLGSGAGNDGFVARHEVGPAGRVIGVDFAPTMVAKARANAQKLGFDNVEFRLGELEALPVDTNSVDVVVSNCVLNLVPNKPKVMAEMFRVLRPGGHFSVSDVVLTSPLALQAAAALYVGCVAGAVALPTYLSQLHERGFTEVTVRAQKPITLPDDLLRRHLTEAEVASFRAADVGIVSVTVYGEKPAARG